MWKIWIIRKGSTIFFFWLSLILPRGRANVIVCKFLLKNASDQVSWNNVAAHSVGYLKRIINSFRITSVIIYSSLNISSETFNWQAVSKANYPNLWNIASKIKSMLCSYINFYKGILRLFIRFHITLHANSTRFKTCFIADSKLIPVLPEVSFMQ